MGMHACRHTARGGRAEGAARRRSGGGGDGAGGHGDGGGDFGDGGVHAMEPPAHFEADFVADFAPSADAPTSGFADVFATESASADAAVDAFAAFGEGAHGAAPAVEGIAADFAAFGLAEDASPPPSAVEPLVADLPADLTDLADAVSETAPARVEAAEAGAPSDALDDVGAES